jgi:hypothetical protein
VAEQNLELTRETARLRVSSRGWAVVIDKGDDGAHFHAFFSDEESARDEACRFGDCDPDEVNVVVAILTPRGLVCSNLYQLETHEELEAYLAQLPRQQEHEDGNG